MILTFIAKFLTPISLPLLATIFWQRKTGVPWTGAAAAVAAATIFALLRIPLHQIVDLPIFIPEGGYRLIGLSIESVALTFIYGTVRETVRWTIFRYPAHRMQTWQEAILFGLAYATAAAMIDTTRYFSGTFITAAYELETIIAKQTTSFDPETLGRPPGALQVIASLVNGSPEEIFKFVNKQHGWPGMILPTLKTTIVLTALNISTTLATFTSARKRIIWPFAAAVLCYTATAAIGKQFSSIVIYTSMTDNPEFWRFLRWGIHPYVYIFLPTFLKSIPGITLWIIIRKWNGGQLVRSK